MTSPASMSSDSHAERDDRYDEMWDGVLVIAPLPNDEHQDLVNELCYIFRLVLDRAAGDRVRPGVNVSDRSEDWTHNFRCPDVVVYRANTTAINHGTHWQGGPDFAVEIVSPGEDATAKLVFYTAVATRELLVIERDPWQLTLYRLDAGQLRSVGPVGVDGVALASEILPLTFRLAAGPLRPIIRVGHADGRVWPV
jgi:Uma2 family endonuclease